ncbi:MAG: tetratricopeptide repeat protein [bacterium]|nr:tetratricopeptide repeat protein [bacterium]
MDRFTHQSRGECSLCFLPLASEIRQSLERLQSLCPETEAWNNLGSSYAELDLLDRAVDAYGSALRADPCYPDAHFNLADTLENLNQLATARVHWVTYLEQDPRSLEATHVRERIATIDAKSPPRN